MTHLCHVVCEQQGDGEGVDVTHLCHVVCEQQGDGEGVDVVAEAQLDDVADAEDDLSFYTCPMPEQSRRKTYLSARTSFDAGVRVGSVVHQQDQATQRVGVQRHRGLEALWLRNHHATERREIFI